MNKLDLTKIESMNGCKEASGKSPSKRKGNWRGRVKDAKKEKLVLDYYYEHPEVTYRKIAEAVGVAEVTAYKTLRAHGLILSKDEAQHARRRRHEVAVLEYCKSNPEASVQTIAEAVSLAQATVRKVLAAYNIPVVKPKRKESDRVAKKRSCILEYRKSNPDDSIEEIAKALGYSPSYVYTTLKRNGEFPMSKKSGYEQEIMKYKRENPNVSLREISEITGFAITTIRNTLIANGIHTSREEKKRRYEQEILKYKHNHPDCSQKEVAEFVGVSSTTVHNVLAAYGMNTSALRKIS